MKRQLLFAFLALFSVLSSTAQRALPHDVLGGGKNSEVYEQKYYIIRSAAEWKSIKEASVLNDPEIQKTLKIFDFTKKALLLYFAGDACNGMELSGLKRELFRITIRISRLSYEGNCRDAKLLVTPWMLISFDASPDVSISLTDDVKVVHCD